MSRINLIARARARLTGLPRRWLLGASAAACSAALVPVAAVAATASPAGASTPACATSGLVVWLDTNGDGFAGGTGFKLHLTNESGHACSLFGFPGVSAVSLAGHQLGRAATRDGLGPERQVRLANNATATATVLIHEVGAFSTARCHPVTAAGLRVFPPGQRKAKVAPFPFRACSRSGPVYLMIGPVHK